MEESRLKEMTTKELERLKIQHDAAQDFGRKWRECQPSTGQPAPAKNGGVDDYALYPV